MTHRLSHHAAQRGQQRGVPERLIALVVDHHDIEFDVEDGCRLLRLSRKMAAAVAASAEAPGEASRLAAFALIHSDRTDQIVTVLRDRAGARGRRYRRRIR
jgi:hypothetical protein